MPLHSELHGARRHNNWVQIQPGLKMIVGTEQIGVPCAG